MTTTMQALSEKLNDQRIAKLPSQANCWSGGPDIYTVLSDAMKDAGFDRSEYYIERGNHAENERDTVVLTGHVRANDPQYNVYLRAK